jgi:hypothetical protein
MKKIWKNMEFSYTLAKSWLPLGENWALDKGAAWGGGGAKPRRTNVAQS